MFFFLQLLNHIGLMLFFVWFSCFFYLGLNGVCLAVSGLQWFSLMMFFYFFGGDFGFQLDLLDCFCPLFQVDYAFQIGFYCFTYILVLDCFCGFCFSIELNCFTCVFSVSLELQILSVFQFAYFCSTYFSLNFMVTPMFTSDVSLAPDLPSRFCFTLDETLVIQIPAEEVFLVVFMGLSISSGGFWMSRESIPTRHPAEYVLGFPQSAYYPIC